MPAKKIIHKDSAVAKAHIKPLGRTARVSQEAAGLMNDLRIESCRFGGAKEAAEIEQAWINMQMRFADLAEFVGKLERTGAYKLDATLSF
jgi:hypothetical protein